MSCSGGSPGRANSGSRSEGDQVCCASRAYLAAHGTPRTPVDLKRHEHIVNREFEVGAPSWMFTRDRSEHRIDVKGRLVLSSLVMAHEAALASAGIAVLPGFLCEADLAAGRLVRLLADWSLPLKEIRVVYASSRHLTSRVRVFVDALEKATAQH